MLRNRADIRTLAYMAVTTALLLVNWNLPSFNVITFVWACFMGVTVSVMAHNHNHLPIWKSKRLNQLTDYWITVFYGFPAFAWIPTHNANHHRYTNREPDYTRTYRYTERNNLLTLVTYPTISGLHQQSAIKNYLQKLWHNNRSRFWFSISQYGVLITWVVGALLLDWKKALLYVVIPQQVGLYAVLIFNYVQHIHADEESEYNHSRNIVGFWLNALLFNNGFHTVHHMKPTMHWSDTPQGHAEHVEPHIDPALNERTFWGMIFKYYILGAVFPKYRSHNMRAERMEKAKSKAVAA